MCITNVSGKNNKTGDNSKMKKIKKASNMVLKIVERIARNEVEKARDGYPPVCLGIGHQPKRPKKK